MDDLRAPFNAGLTGVTGAGVTGVTGVTGVAGVVGVAGTAEVMGAAVKLSDVIGFEGASTVKGVGPGFDVMIEGATGAAWGRIVWGIGCR